MNSTVLSFFFRPDSRGGVIADMSFGFTHILSDELRRNYLSIILGAWKDGAFGVEIHDIFVKDTDGKLTFI